MYIFLKIYSYLAFLFSYYIYTMNNYLASTEENLYPKLCSNTKVYEPFNGDGEGKTSEAIDKTFGTADRDGDVKELQQYNNKLNQAILKYNKVNKQVVSQFNNREKIMTETGTNKYILLNDESNEPAAFYINDNSFLQPITTDSDSDSPFGQLSNFGVGNIKCPTLDSLWDNNEEQNDKAECFIKYFGGNGTYVFSKGEEGGFTRIKMKTLNIKDAPSISMTVKQITEEDADGITMDQALDKISNTDNPNAFAFYTKAENEDDIKNGFEIIIFELTDTTEENPYKNISVQNVGKGYLYVKTQNPNMVLSDDITNQSGTIPDWIITQWIQNKFFLKNDANDNCPELTNTFKDIGNMSNIGLTRGEPISGSPDNPGFCGSSKILRSKETGDFYWISDKGKLYKFPDKKTPDDYITCENNANRTVYNVPDEYIKNAYKNPEIGSEDNICLAPGVSENVAKEFYKAQEEVIKCANNVQNKLKTMIASDYITDQEIQNKKVNINQYLEQILEERKKFEINQSKILTQQAQSIDDHLDYTSNYYYMIAWFLVVITLGWYIVKKVAI